MTRSKKTSPAKTPSPAGVRGVPPAEFLKTAAPSLPNPRAEAQDSEASAIAVGSSDQLALDLYHHRYMRQVMRQLPRMPKFCSVSF